MLQDREPMQKIISNQRAFSIDRFRLRNDLPILASHLDLLFDERKGRESVHDNGRKKGDSDPNEIVLYRNLLYSTFKFKTF